MAIDYNKALQRAMSICSRSEKSGSDINDALKRWGLESGQQRVKIISKLGADDFINEERYARAYVRDKHLFNKWGRIKLSVMLRSKGISKETIKDALETIDGEKYYLCLKEELIKKRLSVKSSNQYEAKAKLIRFASSKGYESDVIFRALNEMRP